MSGYFSSSVGKKFFMALTGLFLIVFLLVHLIANLTLFGGADAFNAASHFMGTNPLIQIMQPVLALGFIAHIGMGIILELKNNSSRPINYAKNNAAANATWVSRNMIITGLMVFAFLVLHIIHYFVPFKFQPENIEAIGTHYDFVIARFQSPFYTFLYVLAFILLGLHLIHGFQSSLTTTGIRNEKYRKCIVTLGIAFSLLIALGFSAIALYFHFS